MSFLIKLKSFYRKLTVVLGLIASNFSISTQIFPIKALCKSDTEIEMTLTLTSI